MPVRARDRALPRKLPAHEWFGTYRIGLRSGRPLRSGGRWIAWMTRSHNQKRRTRQNTEKFRRCANLECGVRMYGYRRDGMIARPGCGESRGILPGLCFTAGDGHTWPKHFAGIAARANCRLARPMHRGRDGPQCRRHASSDQQKASKRDQSGHVSAPQRSRSTGLLPA